MALQELLGDDRRRPPPTERRTAPSLTDRMEVGCAKGLAPSCVGSLPDRGTWANLKQRRGVSV